LVAALGFHCGADAVEDGVHVLGSFEVGYPEDGDSDRFQASLAALVGFAAYGEVVDVAVQLYGEAYFGRVEVEDEGFDGVLAAELDAVQFAIAELGPEQALHRRHVGAEF